MKGASFSFAFVIIRGVANLLADGFSMSVGNYFSTKAAREENSLYWIFKKVNTYIRRAMRL